MSGCVPWAVAGFLREEKAMTADQAKDIIAKYVAAVGGCKGIEIQMQSVVKFTDFKITDLVTELVADKKLIEIEYVLPDGTYNVQSFLLPAGTKITIAGHHE
jgi:hypothetical protein